MKLMNFSVVVPTKQRHEVGVVIHKTLNIMRKSLARLGHETPETCVATCFDCEPCSKNKYIAQIHLCAECLDPFTIVHESTHAAIHIDMSTGDGSSNGVPFIAARISDEIFAFCFENKIKFKNKFRQQTHETENILNKLVAVMNPKTAILN